MAKPAKKSTSKSVSKTSASSSKPKPSATAKKAAPRKSAKPTSVKGKTSPKSPKPLKGKVIPKASKSVTKTKPVPKTKSVTKTKPAPKTKPVPKAKPAPKAKPLPKAKPAPKAKPTPKAKVAAAKPLVKQLVTKKSAGTAKSDKPLSIRATRGAPVTVKPTPKRVVPREIPMQAVVFPSKNPHSKVFINTSQQRLLQLKDDLVDSMSGMASETLRSRAQDSEASAFGMHQADAGSDAYDRDFTLSLLSQEQDALYEIEEALKRIAKGTYGICELSGKTIPVERLEVRPYARYTVEIQEIVDREHGPNSLRRGIRSLFGLGTDDEDEDGDEDSVEEEKN